jgi:hypothetical protein
MTLKHPVKKAPVNPPLTLNNHAGKGCIKLEITAWRSMHGRKKRLIYFDPV